MDFDAIVVGSGFGGAITGCRLAEAGYRVLILERGRRWEKSNYPRRPDDAWTWSQLFPELENGWVDLRAFPGMTVVQGAGVGGGSPLYANVSVEAPAERFLSGWPTEITYSELKPYYDRVGAYLNVQKVPENQWSERVKLLKDAAEAIGQGDRFRPVDLAVWFDPNWTYDQDDPHNPKNSKRFINAQGVEQGTCVHLGNCLIGCDADARNTLDRNYLPWAEKHRAEVRPLHLVTVIEPLPGGYRIHYDELRNQHRISGAQTARLVILAAGSLGSTELLLRCRDLARTLPAISPRLGQNWSNNGNSFSPTWYATRSLSPDRGPSVGAALDFLDGSQDGQSFAIEDGGLPSAVDAVHQISPLLRYFLRTEPFRNLVSFLSVGVDAAGGVLTLSSSEPPQLDLVWDDAPSRLVFDAVGRMRRQLALATRGIPITALATERITAHPLGGCNMGAVVDHRAQVFGYENLYVADGSIVPTPLGVNPSRTIGALAERIAALIIAEGR